MRKGANSTQNSSTTGSQLESSAVSEIISPLKYNDLGKAPAEPKPKPKMDPIPQDDSDKASREESRDIKENEETEDVPDWLREAMNDGPYIPLEILEKKEDSIKNEKLRAQNESKNQVTSFLESVDWSRFS